MSKKTTAPNTTAPKTAAPMNTSAPEAPVKPADVLAAEAAQAASQATTTEGPANQPDGNVENLPPMGDAQGDGSALPNIVIDSVTVTSAADGFRRAGRAWSRTPTTVPLDELGEEQIIALEKEPLLLVVYNAAGEEKQVG